MTSPSKPTSSQRAKITSWISTKAADTWAGFGKAKGGWQLKIYQTGERLIDRIEFEESALKSLDPSLAPTALQPDIHHPKITVPLIYPPSINSGSVALDELRALVAFRIPRHRKGFLTWMIVAPFMAPFMIIPVIPNLPFFFCVWRSWSHYKAYRASQYLQSLLHNDSIIPEASEALDAVYKDFAPHPSPDSNLSPKSPGQRTSPSEQSTSLLTRDAVPLILKIFGLKLSSGADLQRAIEQARLRTKS